MNKYLFVHITPFSELGHNSIYTNKTRGVTKWTGIPVYKLRRPLRHNYKLLDTTMLATRTMNSTFKRQAALE